MAGRERAVECRRGVEGGYRLAVEGAACAVSSDGAAIVRESATDLGPLVDLFLGPALVLALALQGVLCLHAGAVEAGGRIVALVGDSGAGKSMLAGLMGWRRAADDTLSVARAAIAANPMFQEAAR